MTTSTYLDRIVESVKSAYVLSADLQVDCALDGHENSFVFDVRWRVDDHHPSNRVLRIVITVTILLTATDELARTYAFAIHLIRPLQLYIQV